jgi:DNA repair photolyase
MDYWELRSIAAKIVPRMTQLFRERKKVNAVREKGRKKGYKQYNLRQRDWVKQERLLNTEEVNSFAEISVRAQACPMPLNLDVWDGLICPFACKYCFANAFRASLYTAFFDNAKTMGFRHCNPDFYKAGLDKLMLHRGKDPHETPQDVPRAIAMEIPMRLGIRFEDFLKDEEKAGISLELLRYLKELDYPVMINTKSDLVGHDDYLEALSGNKGKAAVHVTVISADDKILKTLEPGAPSFDKRVEACRRLADVGVRPVARIEPFLIFLCDDPDMVEEYMVKMWDAGVRHITFDTYSYTANNPGIKQDFINCGIDYERMFLLGCDSQGLGSLLLGKFMDLFRARGFSCSTFDIGNSSSNDQAVCCEVGDWYEDTAGFNYGCTVMAARFVKDRGLIPTHWKDFEAYVNEHGGFISDSLKEEVHKLWNVEGQEAYASNWCEGIEPIGGDQDGIVWNYTEGIDFREKLLEDCL